MKAVITGNGRIARAILHFIKEFDLDIDIEIYNPGSSLNNTDLIIGTLPSGLGEESLKLAIENKIDLIDLADLETDFYINNSKKINESGITVLPGCGFCPGLVNFILGKEFKNNNKIDTVTVKAGSLSPVKSYFPFLWCFEDMVLEFLNPSYQIVNNKKMEFPAFDGYEEEKLFDIDTESYLCQSGFENLLSKAGQVNNFYYRNIRPKGFMHFFKFMHNYGFFNEYNLISTKTVLEKKVEDNISCSTITISHPLNISKWVIKSFSKKDEKLNSMQKITSLFTIAVLRLLLNNKINIKGLIFAEDIGSNSSIFDEVIAFLKKNEILIENKSN